MVMPFTPSHEHLEAARRHEADIAAKRSLSRRAAVQNFLLQNLEFFANENSGIDYESIKRVKTNEPAVLLNKLLRRSTRDEIDQFLQIKPYQIAALVPTIRLFLVYSGSDKSKKDKVVELKFEDKTNSDIGSISESRLGRGDGVGIRSFSVETQGTNPAEGALVKCDLEIFFQNIEMLASQSIQEDPSHHDYIELILRRTKNPAKTHDSRGNEIPYSRITNRFGFRLMAQVGWAVPEGKLVDEKLKDVLRESQEFIYLHLLDHRIDFNQDGTGVLLCNYQGALERTFSDIRAYDLLKVSEENKLQERINSLEEAVEARSEEGERLDEDDKEAKEKVQKSITELKERIEKLKKPLRAQKYAQIINRLYLPRSGESRVRIIDLTPDQVEKFARGEEFSISTTVPTSGTPTTRAASAATASRLASSFGATARRMNLADPKPLAKGNTRMTYVYFGDLVQVAKEIIESNFEETGQAQREGLDDFEVILGPLTYKKKVGDKYESGIINLADVPISLKSFEVWFERNIRKRNLDSYSFMSFLNSTTSELVLAALGEFMGVDKKLKFRNRVGIQTFLASPLSSTTKTIDLDSGDRLKLVRSLDGKKEITGLKPYVVVFASVEIPVSRDPTLVGKDMEDGIYHFHLGSDRGILKSINFSKTDIPHLRAARMTSQDAEEGQLRDKYDATINLIGSSFLFRPGQKLYLNPTLIGFGSLRSRTSTARLLGLGGYYDIITVTSEFGVDRGYTTTLKCAWQTFGKTEDASEEAPSSAVGITTMAPDGSPMTVSLEVEDIPLESPFDPDEDLMTPDYAPPGPPLSERLPLAGEGESGGE